MAFESIKNPLVRKKALRLLSEIASATSDPTKGFLIISKKDGETLTAGESTFFEVTVNTGDATGETVAVRATTAGLAAAATIAPAQLEAKTEVPKVKPTVEVLKGIGAPPAYSRGGSTESIYKFDQLEVGDGFFVEATASMPNPGKTLASAVSAATAKYATATPKRVFTIRSNQKHPVTGASGAIVYRIEPPAEAPATRAPVA